MKKIKLEPEEFPISDERIKYLHDHTDDVEIRCVMRDLLYSRKEVEKLGELVTGIRILCKEIYGESCVQSILRLIREVERK
jgi:hypothetical protein